MHQMPGQFPPPPDPAAEPAPGGGQTLYPLSLDRILQLTFSLYRHRWIGFIGLTLVVMLPALVAVALLQAAVGEDFARFQQAQLDAAEGLPIELADLLPVNAFVVTYLVLAITEIAGYIAMAAIVQLMAGTYAGQRVSIVGALSAVARRLPTLLGLAVIVFLAIFGLLLVGGLIGIGLIAATMVGGQIQPGLGFFGALIVFVATVAAIIFITIRWSFPVQIAMLEGQGALGALGRSWRLVSGSSWRVLGYTLFLALLIGVFAILAETLATVLVGGGFRQAGGVVVFEPGNYLLVSIISGLVSVLLTPISVIALTLLYFDLRWRRGDPPLATSAPEQRPSAPQ